MKRKLILLDLVLVALTALAGWQLRQEWLYARAREAGLLGQSIKPVPPPPAAAALVKALLSPATYLDIAQKMLFSKDRNPVVVVETPPPPPPKPMPPLPVLHGVMNLGDGPTAIFTEKPGAMNRDYRPGDQVGEFKLIAVNNQEVVLEWDGKTVVRKVEEMVVREPEEDKAAAAPAQRSTAPPPPPAPKIAAGPGVDIGKGMRACVQNDSTPPGTVQDGLRKIVTESPFGPVCRWEPVR